MKNVIIIQSFEKVLSFSASLSQSFLAQCVHMICVLSHPVSYCLLCFPIFCSPFVSLLSLTSRCVCTHSTSSLFFSSSSHLLQRIRFHGLLGENDISNFERCRPMPLLQQLNLCGNIRMMWLVVHWRCLVSLCVILILSWLLLMLYSCVNHS
jgi:hypothetical protein